MKILDLVQGEPEWVAARFNYFCASDAPVMMGASSHTTRTELLRMKSSGDAKEFSEWVKKNLLEKGHEAEALARLNIEHAIGEELYPMTACEEGEGLSLLASYDGVTMEGETGFEHKLWNEDLAAAVHDGDLPPMYYWQLEQQILIANLKRVIFVCSDGTTTKFVRMTYEPVPGRAEKLLAGWKQFAEDLKTYEHVEYLPKPAGKALMALPPLMVELVGEVKKSNLVAYRQTALAFISSINTVLKTDQDFADAEKTVKFCGDAEVELEAVKKHALGQTASIDELFRTVDVLREEMRGKRLELEKLIKARKEAIREEIRNNAVALAVKHIASLNDRLGRHLLTFHSVVSDFAGVMKGKKTVASLQDAVNTELARIKIESNALADRIQVNINYLAECGAGKEFLFSDTATIVLKQPDDFKALCKNRLAEHKEKEERRITEDRERIRKEEVDRLERERLARPDGGPVAFKAAQAAAKPARPDVVEQTQTAPPPFNPTHKVQRPEDEVMIHLLALTYGVTIWQIIQWLREMDLDAVAKRMSEVA